MENMEYYTQRLQCSDEEKDACLETVAKLYRLRLYVRRSGDVAADIFAETETDPFSRACFQEFWEYSWDHDRLERQFLRYLMAGNYWGGAFLNAVLISQGLLLIDRYQAGAYFPRDWDEVLCEELRGYFGAAYREKVVATIEREEVWYTRAKRKWPSLIPEFDKLTELSPQQRDWLVPQIPVTTLEHALKAGGIEVSEFLVDGVENPEQLKTEMAHICVPAWMIRDAQRKILEKTAESISSANGTV